MWKKYWEIKFARGTMNPMFGTLIQRGWMGIHVGPILMVVRWGKRWV